MRDSSKRKVLVTLPTQSGSYLEAVVRDLGFQGQERPWRPYSILLIA